MSSQGYTIVEATVSVLLLSVVLLGVHGSLVAGNRLAMEDTSLLDIQQQARNAMDRMVREIRQSSAHTIVVNDADSDTITFTTPLAGGVKYYREGVQLVREYPSGNKAKVATNIARLKFTIDENLLTLNLRADKTNYGNTTSFPLVENVRLRNE